MYNAKKAKTVYNAPIKRRHRRDLDSHGFIDRTVSVLTYMFFIFFAFICIYPFYYIFINTISSNELSRRGVVMFYPMEVHFKNYVEVLKLPELKQAGYISLMRTVIGTVFTLTASAFMAFMFTSNHMWARKFWYRFVIATMYFNAGIIPWYLTMMNLGLTNNFWGYVLPAIVSPFFIILVKTFIESIPKELREAAEIDGAGTLRIFIQIMLPVIKPILATVAIFSAVNQWNAFQDTLLLMTRQDLYTLQFTLYQYIQRASALKSVVNNTAGGAAAMALAQTQTAASIKMTVTIVVVFPIMCVYPIFQRYFVKGIMIGAVKG